MKYSTLFGGLLLCWIRLAQAGPAEFLEITTELDSTWQASTKTNHHSHRTRCVIGTNYWLIEGDFAKNARVSYWLAGTNVIERTVITSSMYIEQAKDFVSEKILRRPRSGFIGSYPRAGETFTTLHPAPEGQPAGSGVAKAVWLAFCSGLYLHENGRNVPLPIGGVKESWEYFSKTVTFEEEPNLPERVQFFSSDGKLIGTYEVFESTNSFGWTLPLKFTIIQHGVRRTGEPNFSTKTELTGRVISIRPCKEPKPPDEVSKEIAK